jgi:FKBP-type peptidyl-prolyl cis-trans isomerase
VEVNYTGWTTDGTIVDGAPIGGPPATFQLSQTMPGWREGLRMMSVGDKWRFWIPPHLTYGDQPGKPTGMLVYDIDLVRFAN